MSFPYGGEKGNEDKPGRGGGGGGGEKSAVLNKKHYELWCVRAHPNESPSNECFVPAISHN